MPDSPSRVRRIAIVALAAAALIYAFCAGFRTIGDFDFGWQISAGRYLVQHHQIPRADVLALTQPGTEWLYPPFGGLILYLVFAAGGYAALSWLLAAAAVLTISLLLRRPGMATCLAAILAVPSVVFRENPRAELFTTVLFAAYLALLWSYFRTGRGRLWLLPALMFLWVNLHPGFISGLALLAGYVALETCEFPFRERRAAALDRLRRAVPWLLAAVVATILNPWGIRVYAGIVRQNRSVKELGDFIGEWSRPNLSHAAVHQMFRWRDPESSFWWLLAFSVIAIAVAIRRKQLGAAVLLAGASTLSVQYLRFQGLFACMAVVLGGAMLDEIDFRGWQRASTSTVPNLNILRTIVAIGCVPLVLCTGIRCADLVTNRHYIEAGEVVLFGPGEATWFPERAAKFIEDNHLAGNMFNDYNLGGFLEWRLPQYKAYVDSRAIPFGVDRLVQQRTLLRAPLDSPQWAQAAAENNINFAVVSLDRYTGLGKVPLQDDCRSRSWRPVYLDDAAAVFLRNTTENTALIQKFGIDCATMQLPQPDYTRGTTYRAKGNAYNFFANAGSVFYMLARDRDAHQFLLQAAGIEPHDANLHLTLAQLYQADGQVQDAEREYKSSIAERPTDLAWYLLGILYGKQQRYAEAIAALEHSAAISYQAADRYRVIGQIQNTMGNPTAALESLHRAEHAGSHGSVDDRRIFASQLAAARARSWELLHDLNRAIEEQSRAADLMPDDPNRWAALANLYREQGNSQEAQEAQARADSLVRAPVSR